MAKPKDLGHGQTTEIEITRRTAEQQKEEQSKKTATARHQQEIERKEQHRPQEIEMKTFGRGKSLQESFEYLKSFAQDLSAPQAPERFADLSKNLKNLTLQERTRFLEEFANQVKNVSDGIFADFIGEVIAQDIIVEDELFIALLDSAIDNKKINHLRSAMQLFNTERFNAKNVPILFKLIQKAQPLVGSSDVFFLDMQLKFLESFNKPENINALVKMDSTQRNALTDIIENLVLKTKYPDSAAALLKMIDVASNMPKKAIPKNKNLTELLTSLQKIMPPKTWLRFATNIEILWKSFIETLVGQKKSYEPRWLGLNPEEILGVSPDKYNRNLELLLLNRLLKSLNDYKNPSGSHVFDSVHSHLKEAFVKLLDSHFRDVFYGTDGNMLEGSESMAHEKTSDIKRYFEENKISRDERLMIADLVKKTYVGEYLKDDFGLTETSGMSPEIVSNLFMHAVNNGLPILNDELKSANNDALELFAKKLARRKLHSRDFGSVFSTFGYEHYLYTGEIADLYKQTNDLLKQNPINGEGLRAVSEGLKELIRNIDPNRAAGAWDKRRMEEAKRELSKLINGSDSFKHEALQRLRARK